jgi:hypothetical protein
VVPKPDPKPEPEPNPKLPNAVPEPEDKPSPADPKPLKPATPESQVEPERDRPARRFVGLISGRRTGVLTERLERPKRKTLLGE